MIFKDAFKSNSLNTVQGQILELAEEVAVLNNQLKKQKEEIKWLTWGEEVAKKAKIQAYDLLEEESQKVEQLTQEIQILKKSTHK